MKLIRDIISEKRQMAARAVEETAPALTEAFEDESPEVQEAIPSEEAPCIEAPSDSVSDDEFAAFFAEDEDEQFVVEDDQAEEPATDKLSEIVLSHPAESTVSGPSKLVLGKDFAVDTQANEIKEKDCQDALETTAPPAKVVAPSADAKPDDEQSLRNVFRELNETSEDAGFEPSAEPVNDEIKPAAEPDSATLDASLDVQKTLQGSVMPEMTQLETPQAEQQNVEVPKPAPGRGTSRHGRVKTRLLGFNTTMDAEIDPIKASDQAKPAAYVSFPVGWLIVVEGEGRGSAFSLFNGVSNIGRGTDQTVCLDFGDNSISREAHASIAYDPRQQSFYIGHCGKANIVRRNDRPVLSTEELSPGDHITIGETVLRFVPLCGPDFSWEQAHSSGQARAANG